jgi:hypothetical protein
LVSFLACFPYSEIRSFIFVLLDENLIENDSSNNTSFVGCIFVVAGTCLPIHYLVTIWGYTCRHTDLLEGFMKYAVEMGSGAMLGIQSFGKIDSGIHKLIDDIHRHIVTP